MKAIYRAGAALAVIERLIQELTYVDIDTFLATF